MHYSKGISISTFSNCSVTATIHNAFSQHKTDIFWSLSQNNLENLWSGHDWTIFRGFRFSQGTNRQRISFEHQSLLTIWLATWMELISIIRYLHTSADTFKLKANKELNHGRTIAAGFRAFCLFCSQYRLLISMQPKTARTWLVNTVGLQRETRPLLISKCTRFCILMPVIELSLNTIAARPFVCCKSYWWCIISPLYNGCENILSFILQWRDSNTTYFISFYTEKTVTLEWIHIYRRVRKVSFLIISKQCLGQQGHKRQ